MKGGDKMARGANGNTLASWAFLIGFLIAIILGVGWLNQYESQTLVILVIIGIFVGFFNITATETDSFLISGAVLIIASSLGADAMSAFDAINNILNALLAMFVPATVIVAVKHVFNLAKR